MHVASHYIVHRTTQAMVHRTTRGVVVHRTNVSRGTAAVAVRRPTDIPYTLYSTLYIQRPKWPLQFVTILPLTFVRSSVTMWVLDAWMRPDNPTTGVPTSCLTTLAQSPPKMVRPSPRS